MKIDLSVISPLEFSDTVDEGQTLVVVGVHEEGERIFILVADGEDEYMLRVYVADKAELPDHSLSELGSFNIFFEETDNMKRRIKRIHRVCSLNAGSKLGV